MARRRAQLGFATAFALLALTLLPVAPATAAGTVSVTGKATLEVPNDTAAVGLGTSAERAGKGAALRVVAQRLRAVIAVAQTIPGVGAGDVRTGTISVRKTTRGERTMWRASQGITVTLHEPERAGELVAAAIAKGASAVRGPRFFVGDTAAAYSLALTAAFDQARAKAAALAARAGAPLGEVLSIAEGGGVERAPVSAPKTAEGRADATPSCKPSTTTVTATVSVVFALQ